MKFAPKNIPYQKRLLIANAEVHLSKLFMPWMVSNKEFKVGYNKILLNVVKLQNTSREAWIITLLKSNGLRILAFDCSNWIRPLFLKQSVYLISNSLLFFSFPHQNQKQLYLRGYLVVKYFPVGVWNVATGYPGGLLHRLLCLLILSNSTCKMRNSL